MERYRITSSSNTKLTSTKIRKWATFWSVRAIIYFTFFLTMSYEYFVTMPSKNQDKKTARTSSIRYHLLPVIQIMLFNLTSNNKYFNVNWFSKNWAWYFIASHDISTILQKSAGAYYNIWIPSYNNNIAIMYSICTVLPIQAWPQIVKLDTLLLHSVVHFTEWPLRVQRSTPGPV